jgi:hypothetical protein
VNALEFTNVTVMLAGRAVLADVSFAVGEHEFVG